MTRSATTGFCFSYFICSGLTEDSVLLGCSPSFGFSIYFNTSIIKSFFSGKVGSIEFWKRVDLHDADVGEISPPILILHEISVLQSSQDRLCSEVY